MHPAIAALPLNRDPLTEKNGALMAYVTLVVAHEMKQEGMTIVAEAMEKAAVKLMAQHGRIPAGLYIPPDVYHRVYDSVVAAAQAGAEEGMKVAMEAMPKV